MHSLPEVPYDQLLLLGSRIVQQYIPILFTGQDLLHSCLHFLGLHLSALTIAILVSFSLVAIAN